MKRAFKIQRTEDFYNLLDNTDVREIVGMENVISFDIPRLLIINDNGYKFDSEGMSIFYEREGYKIIDAKIYSRKDKLKRIPL